MRFENRRTTFDERIEEKEGKAAARRTRRASLRAIG